MMKRFVLILFLFSSLLARAQKSNAQIDSMKADLLHEQHDTSKAKTANLIADAYRYIDANKNREYALRALNWSRSAGYQSGMGKAYNLLAQSFENQGMYAEAIVYYDSSLAVMRLMNSKSDEAKILLNISNVYQKTADYATSVKYCMQSLQMQEEINDTFGIAVCRLTLGNIQYSQGDNKSALMNYLSAIEMNHASARNPAFEGSAVTNIGAILDHQGSYDSALVYLRQSLQIFSAIHADAKMASTMNNLGNCFFNLNQNDSALYYLRIGQQMNERLQRPDGLAPSLRGIGNVLRELKQYDSAFYYFRKSLAVSMQHNLKEDLLSCYSSMADGFEEAGKPDSALFYLRKYIALNELIHGEDELRKIDQVRQNYSINKKEQELRLQEAQSELQAESLRNKISLLAGGVAVLILLSLLLYTRFRSKKQIAAVLQNKNLEITQQKDEITDSINYARRIQDSILAPEHVVKEVIPESFILYLPKDVVSGDFYWVEEENGHRIFAAVDCTGHGVPGALMSVVGFNLLNRAVKELHLTKPSDILQQLDYGVNKLLRQSDSGNTVKDGMDLSLCSYHPETRMLQYAGVFNPLYIVRDKKIIQITADKSPIGVNVSGVVDSFTNHEIQMQPGDMIYLFSDGYADQFGGPKGKKYKYNQLRELLISISPETTVEQERQLKHSFLSWMGELEQVDDVLIMGIRIS